MKTLKFCVVALLAFAAVTFLSLPIGMARVQGSTALERGYRTGYSDGYDSGFKDKTNRANRDYQSKDDYQRADRSYVDVWGPIEDYRDGYQQGYEAGYTAGYDRRPFESSLPAGFKKRGGSAAQDSQSSTKSPVSTADSGQGQSAPPTNSADLSGSIHIP